MWARSGKCESGIAACLVLVSLFGGCRTLQRTAQLPVDYSVVRGQLVIYSDFALPAQHRLLDDLVAQRDTISALLALPPSNVPIHVYLFETADSYHAFIRRYFPDFPQRRAFFVESEGQFAVYAHWGDRVAEDLRHEVAHGYLHAAVDHLPLWLDEGLAEYFEVPAGLRGFNEWHVAELQSALEQSDWRPDLKRLDAIDSVAEMDQRDYAESWAWVHFLLEDEPSRRELLRDYVGKLSRGEQVGSAVEWLGSRHYQPNVTLTEYIASLYQPGRAAPSPTWRR